MTERWWHPALRFAASRAPGATLVALVASVGIAVALAPRTYVQPFGTHVEPAPVAPLAPSVVAMVLGTALANRMSTLERLTRVRMRLSRALWATALLGGTALAAQCVAMAAPPAWQSATIRNGVGLAGLALLAAVVLGAQLAWTPILVWTATTLLAGRDPATDTVMPWALLLAPVHSTVALVVAIVTALLGLTGYTFWDSRPASGIARE